MRTKENSPEIKNLSTTAQAILAGHWGMGKGSSITFQNQKSRLSTRAAAAMAELVSAGIVSDTKAADGYADSRTYRLTQWGATLEFRKSLDWMGKNGRFSISEPIT